MQGSGRPGLTAEQTIRSFCIGRRNWMIIDTISGAKASAIIYSLAETAKANNLKPYHYFEHLLTEIPKHMDDTDRSFLEDLLPWSPNLPAECREKQTDYHAAEKRHISEGVPAMEHLLREGMTFVMVQLELNYEFMFDDRHA